MSGSDNEIRPGPWAAAGESETVAPQPDPLTQLRPYVTELEDAEKEVAKRREAARIRASMRLLEQTDDTRLDDAGRAALFRAVSSGIVGMPVQEPSEMFGRRATADMGGNIALLRRLASGEWDLLDDPEVAEWRKVKEQGEEAAAKFAHEKIGGAKDASSLGRGMMFGVEAAAMARAGASWQNMQPALEEMNAATRELSYDKLDEEGKAKWRKERIETYERKLAKGNPVVTFLRMTGGLDDRAKSIVERAWRTGELKREELERYDKESQRQILGAVSLMRGDKKEGMLALVPGVDISQPGWKANLYALQQSILDIPGDLGGMAVDLYRSARASMLSGAEREEAFRRIDLDAQISAALKQPLVEAETFKGAIARGLAENFWFVLPGWAGSKGTAMMRTAQGVKKAEGLAGWFADLKAGLTPWRAGRVAKTAAKEADAAAAALKAERATALSKGVKALGEAKIDVETAQMAMRRQAAAMATYTKAIREVEAIGAEAAKRIPKEVARWWGGRGVKTASQAAMFQSFFREHVEAADAAGVSREDSVPIGLAAGWINALVENLHMPGQEDNIPAAELKYLMSGCTRAALEKAGKEGFKDWAWRLASRYLSQTAKVTAEEGFVEEPIQQLVNEIGIAVGKRQGELRKDGHGNIADAIGDLWQKATADGMAEKSLQIFADAAWDALPGSLGFGLVSLPHTMVRQKVRNWYHGQDEGIADAMQRAAAMRQTVEEYWNGKGKDAAPDAKNPHRFEEALTAARRAWRNPQTGDMVKEVADAAGVDVKTAEVIAQYFNVEADMTIASPRFSAWTSLNMSLADIDEATIKTVLPGYVEGSFASDPENGIYSGRVRMDDGTEKTIAYRVGDFSDELRAEADENAKVGSAFGDSFNERHEELGDGIRWEMLSDAQRYQEALFASNAARMGSGVFELTDSKGRKVRVNADSVIRLANGHIADIGYGPAATQATVRHETFHSLWQFVRGTLADADVQQLAKTLGIDVTADNWERKLDERMAHEMERYASGHYVSHAVSSRFDKMLDSWAGKIINFFGKFGPSDEVTDPKTGKPYQLKGLYDSILRGELGSGTLGVELRKVPAQPATSTSSAPTSSMPVEVTDADRAEAEAKAQAEIKEEEPSPAPTSPAPTVTPAPTAAPVQAATAENPPDASTPNQRYYKVGLPNSPVKLVGRLEVRDAETGVITSTDADYHDRGNQNRDDKSEESRALVEKIGANPDPLQVGTVQPIANNGIVWLLNNSNVIVGNHRVNGVRRAYEKGTAGDLEKFVREDAAKRGIEIGADVKKPLLVFVLERIESPDGKADVHEVVRLANESQNRGFNVREQASNDAKILTDNNLLPRMEFRADGRIDETKSGDAIGKFRQETGAQGMIAEDGSLTEEGQTRIQNAALAALLGGEGNNALLNKIMSNAGRLDMQPELRALMKMTPELMALAEAKPGYDLRGPLAEALQLFTEWRDKDETARVEKGKTRRDWRETKNGTRVRGVSWDRFMSQGDMFRAPSDEAKILGDLFARAEAERSFDREDVESAVGKKRAIDLISDYLTDYIKNARAVNTDTEDMFGGTPATRAEVMAAQRAAGAKGGIRYSLAPNPNLRADIAAALRKNAGGDDTTVQMKRHDEIVFSDNLPFFEFLGLPNTRVVSDVVKVRKFNIKHHLSEDQIAELPYRYNAPVAVMRDGSSGYVLLTDMMGMTDNGETKPVRIFLRPRMWKSGEVVFVATAMAENAKDEKAYYEPIIKHGLLYADENKVAGLALEEETESILRTQASGDDVLTSSDYSWWSTRISITQSSADRNGLSTPAQLLAAVAKGSAKRKEEQQKSQGESRYSTDAPRSRLVYPQLRGMSDEELISAAVAARIALGKSDKVSDRSVKVKTVQNLMRRLHPDWNTTKIGVESQRFMTGAQKLAKRFRDDLGRGVSDSLVLEHLPNAMREQFGREMRQEAREGARLGAFGVRANTALEERQAKIVEDAVRVQTGLDSDVIENAYGINLSETIMHLAENRFTEKDAPQGSAGEGEGSADEEGSASAEESEEAAVEIDAKVKAVVDDIVAASGRQAGSDEQNRQNRKAAAGRDAENEAAMGEGEEGAEAEGASSGEGSDGDALAEAVKKSALDLENPRHLARFVAELARRQWIKEHGLAKDADVWRDLVAVQFLRKTAQSVYAKLVRDLTYSRSRETAMGRIAKLDNVPTVAGLLSEMEFLGALVNAQRIREKQKSMCEKLDLFLRENFSAQGRFKPDKEEGKRKVSAEAELRARYMRKCMWFTPDAAAEEARQLQETLDALSVDFKDAGRDRDQSREFVETIRKLNVLREFGALRYKPVGEIEAAVQWWQDFARGESDDIVREMSDRDIRTKKAAHLLAVAFADPKRTTIREGGKADALNRFITGHMGFISLLQDCMRHASDADAAAVKDIVDYIAREVQKAGDRSEAEKRRHNDAFHSTVEGIYGKSFNAVMKDMMAPDERFTKYMGVIGGKRVTPTKGRALQLLVSLLQEGRKIEVEDEENPGQTKTVWEGGYHDNIVKHHREGQAAEIMRLLTPQDMNMLKWLGQWYENNRSDLAGVCHSLFGIGVYAELPNYFPVEMQLETQGPEKGNGVGWTIFPKALTPRVRNERDFDTSADIFSMWASRMEEAAQWKHHAQLGLEMRGIFGRAELREAVRANHGASVDDLMQGFITDILAGHGAYDRSTAGVQYFSDQIRGWTALCALGGNIGVMFKQVTSIPAFGFEIGLVNTAKYMVSAFTPEGMAAMGKIWDSEQRRTRWNLGSSEAVRNALSQQNAGLLKRMLQKSMITTKLGDVVPGLVVGQGIYRDCLARGMSEEDAMAETWSIIERTQQSGRMENQIQVQRRNKLGRIMFQFLSTQQQYLQYEVRAIREVIARPDSVKRWGNLGRAILLNHFILSSAYFWMGELYKACLGQEPPEDELKDWIITCLLGPYGSLMVAGFMCKATLERAIKGYTWRSPSMLPMESWLKNQVNDGAKLLEAIFDSDGDTWDNMLEAAGRWMSDSNSVVRDLRKIYRYRVKGEQQKK